MHPLKEIVTNVVTHLAAQKPADGVDVGAVWLRVSRESRAHTSVKDFTNGRLQVTVDSPARLFRLTIQKQKLIQELKDILPGLAALDIQVGKVG